MKKTLSILLSFVMLLSITAGLNLTAYAYTFTCKDYEYYIEDNGTATIRKYIGSDTDVIIPTQLDGHTVTGISAAFMDYENLVSVSIPNTITSLGELSFCNCKKLKSITIPDSVEFIGEGAFADTGLTSINIPASVTTIVDFHGVNLFEGCSDLESITVDKNNPVYDSRNNCNAVILTEKNYLLFGCKNTKIPNGITKIYSAFDGNTAITSMEIPEGVTYLAGCTFRGCMNFKSVTIPKSLTTISSFTFYNCPSLKDVYYNGTKADWNNITIWDSESNEDLTNSVIHCTDGVINCKHTYKTTTTKATTSKNGSVVTKCSVCGNVKSKSTIYYPKTITLSSTIYVYDGKVKKPTVTVKDSRGKTISASNYTVTYESGRKYVGKYTVTIKFRGNYSGTVIKTFTIKPKATTLSSITAKSKGFTVKWKKQATQTTGYQIQYSTRSNFSNAKIVTVSKNSTTSKTISKLKGKKKYFVRIRTYKTVNGTKYYSSWSKAKTVTTRK